MVTPSDRFCPGCGLIRPSSHPISIKELDPGSAILIIGLLFAVLSIVGVATTSLGVTATILISLAITMSTTLATVEMYRRLYLRQSGNSLNDIHLRIMARQEEITEKSKKIIETLEKVKSERSTEWRRVEEILCNRLTVLKHHKDQYDIKEAEINIVRWRNRLGPLLDDSDTIDYKTNAERINELEREVSRGTEISSNLQAKLDDVNGRVTVGEKIKAIQDICCKTRQEILARQAVLAIQGTGALSETLDPITLPDKYERQQIVSVAVSEARSLSDEFQSLENSFLRLQAEDNTADLIGTAIADAQRISQS